MAKDGLSWLERFACLLWKNWCIQWKNLHIMLICLFMPTLFITVPIIIRCMLQVGQPQKNIYNPIDLNESWNNLTNIIKKRQEIYFNATFKDNFNVYVPQLAIAYSPSSVMCYVNIMEQVQISLSTQIRLVPFNNCETLKNLMGTEHFLAGICFDENAFNITSYYEETYESHTCPKTLKYTIIYPSELRIYFDTYISADWDTNHLFDNTVIAENRMGDNAGCNDGGYVGYVREGFITLQHKIFLAYYSVAQPNFGTFKIKLRRFPYYKHKIDRLIDGIHISLSLTIAISFLLPLTILTKHIVEERENSLKSALTIMGASQGLQLIAWCIAGLVPIFISSILMVTFIKIPWKNDLAILTKSSWLLLNVLMFFYNLVTVSYAALMSACFTLTRNVIIITAATWVLMYLPYASHINKFSDSFILNLFAYIFPNTAMGLAIDNVQNLEIYDEGLQFSNFFEAHAPVDTFSIGNLILIMLLQSILYIIISMYIQVFAPGKFGIPKKWNELFKRASIIRASTRTGRYTFFMSRKTKVIEIDTTNKRTVLDIENLTKNYNNRFVVTNVTLTLCENETTVLLGHNGCGKTTLMNMIVGLIPSTTGTVKINGYDIHKNPDMAFSNIGMSIHESIIFQNLTVQDQLTFFCRMKGVNYFKCKEEVKKYLDATPLGEEANVYTEKLSKGLRGILCFCCAFIGNSKFVILNNPFDGIDRVTRKRMWDLFLQEKADRTILISTHSYELTEALADRIAIMSGGELKCFGTPNFLKKIYCDGYCLTILKEPSCDETKLTELIQNYIPDITPHYSLGNEICYELDLKHLGVFDNVLNEIEKRAYEFSIIQCKIKEFSLSDIFVQLGADHPSYGNSYRHEQILNGFAKNIDETSRIKLFDNYECLSGYKLTLNHWRAHIFKLHKYHLRNKLLIALIIFLPIIYTLFPSLLLKLSLKQKSLKPMTYKLMQYPKSVTIIESGFPDYYKREFIEESYRQILFRTSSNHKEENVFNTSMEQYLLEKESTNLNIINQLYLVAATFAADITAWFNNYPLHTAPLSLNIMHNAIYHGISYNIDFPIELTFYPLPYDSNPEDLIFRFPLSIAMFLPISISFCLSFVWSLSTIYTVKEKVTEFKFMQFVAGAKRSSFFLTVFLYDMVIVFLTSAIVITAMLIIDYKRFYSTQFSICFFTILIMSGICVFSMNYVLSTLFKDPFIAFSIITTIHFFGVISFALVTEIFYKGHIGTLKPINSLEWILYIMPVFTLSSSLIVLYFNNDLSTMCQNSLIHTISKHVENCNIQPNCCVEYNLWDFETGVGCKLLILTMLTILFWGIIYITESDYDCNIFDYKKENLEEILRSNNVEHYKFQHNENNDVIIDDEIVNEQTHITSMNLYASRETPLICAFISKIYGLRSVINNFCFALKPAECVTLLSAIGAGKKTIFNMISGKIKNNSGYVLVKGHNLDTERSNVYQLLGYTPDKSSLLDEYTVGDILYIICLLRGMPLGEIVDTYENLARALGIFNYINHSISIISTGVKKRVCLAICMLGNSVVYLFEYPTETLDPGSRRLVWNIICLLKKSGRSCFIATNDIREVQVISNRAAILGTNGLLYNLTTLQTLCNKFVDVYMLKVTMKNVTQILTSFAAKRFHKLKKHFKIHYPNSFITEVWGNSIVCIIPIDNSVKMSTIFREMIANTSTFSIDDFILTRTPIEPLILHLLRLSTQYI